MKTLGTSCSRNKVKIHAKVKTNSTSFHFMLGQLTFVNETLHLARNLAP